MFDKLILYLTKNHYYFVVEDNVIYIYSGLKMYELEDLMTDIHSILFLCPFTYTIELEYNVLVISVNIQALKN
jgi:hypothetical protein